MSRQNPVREVLGGAALSDAAAGERGLGLRRTFVIFGYMFVPIGLAMHLAHNLSHLLMEGGGIVPAVQRAVATLSLAFTVAGILPLTRPMAMRHGWTRSLTRGSTSTRLCRGRASARISPDVRARIGLRTVRLGGGRRAFPDHR